LTEGAGFASSLVPRAEGAEIAEKNSYQFRQEFDSAGTYGRASDGSDCGGGADGGGGAEAPGEVRA